MNTIYTIIGKPFGLIMWGIYSVVKNYGISIILFTIITRIIMFPMNFKQQKNIVRSRALAPKMAAIKKAYANNPQRIQEEQMKLQQQEGINPMASCLPMLIQFLFLFGVLDVVYKPLSHILRISGNTIEKTKDIITKSVPDMFMKNDLREELKILSYVRDNQAEFNSVNGFLDKLSGFNSKFMGIDLGATPQFKPEVWDKTAVLLFLIPIVAGVSQLVMTLITQRIQKKNTPDMPSMGAMSALLYVMPVFSVWFAFKVPSGVGFYWIISTIVAIIQAIALDVYFTPERVEIVSAIEKEKAKKRKPGLMQKMLEQQELMNQQNNGSQGSASNRVNYSDETEGLSRSELNAYNRELLKDARRRMAEKYGDELSDDKD
ncbi:MAG: YidC/Oxa1 family membrane protein insertase [Clostridiales bacterium]|nr:YidC/Oxa1 family membrane protein insertase [Clostridiales bacterium]